MAVAPQGAASLNRSDAMRLPVVLVSGFAAVVLALSPASAGQVILLNGVPLVAQATPVVPSAPDVAAEHEEDAWQQVISGQITAFRAGDAPGAFSFAGASFQRSFPNPFAFFQAIIASGYAPIATSKSHSFGTFQHEGPSVLQLVRLVGPNQELFQAVYQLTEEPDGWRVQGVMLSAPAGIGI